MNKFCYLYYGNQNKNRMQNKEISSILELNEWLSDLPQVIKYKDGDAIMDCWLTFSYLKEYKGKSKWVAAYYCGEYDYYLMCGYGVTLIEAVNHLRRVLKDYREHESEDYAGQ